MCCFLSLFYFFEVFCLLLGFFLDFFGCIGVFDFLYVLLIFVVCDDVVLVGNVLVMMLVVVWGWVNFLVMLFLIFGVLCVLIGVIDVCDVVVVIGWLFLCFWIVIFGIEDKEDDDDDEEEDVIVEIEVDEVMFFILLFIILLIDWLFFEVLFIFG